MNRLFKTIRYWLGWILRPHLSYLRIREIRDARSAGAVRSDIPLDSVPAVTLVDISHDENLQKEAIRIFRRNPSPFSLMGRSLKHLRDQIKQGEQYYLIRNQAGENVGCTAFQKWRDMSAHTIIDYHYRRHGYGISAIRELQRVKKQEGLSKIWGQVYKDNKRSLSMLLSLGWEFVPEKENAEYYTMVVHLTDMKNDGTDHD